ncbi:universal stress protein [Mycobacterium sp. WMMD1722]|uniref:universal stress protein n=1 Tax=Mycobacterium sp. WMMD1722 TaxID=3404117 RepID=UPI003BF580EE
MPNTTSPVVVGIDGSERSIAAARWAAAVAEEYDTSLLLVHSTATAGHFISDAAVIAIRAAAAADQRGAAEKTVTMAKDTIAGEFPGLTVDADIVEEPAGKALVRLSRDAEFVVVSSDDVNPVAALLVGSTTMHVASHAVCPVVAWRNTVQPNTDQVVVGVDGTAAGTAALAAAFEYAHNFGAPLVAVHSWSTRLPADEVTIPYLIDWDALEAAEWALLTHALEPWTAKYPDVAVTTLLDDAKPSRSLLDRLSGAQMVVVGNHRSNALSAALIGSTSLNLLHHSSVPVMICHAEPMT